MVLGLENARGMEVEGRYSAGQTVNEWLPACYRITVAHWKGAGKELTRSRSVALKRTSWIDWFSLVNDELNHVT